MLEDMKDSIDQFLLAQGMDPNKGIGGFLSELSKQITNVQEALTASDTPRSQASSTASLGATLSDHFRRQLRSYKWIARNPENCWLRGNDFKTWGTSGFPLPEENSKLNCWEAVMVVLNFYGGLSKEQILACYTLNADYSDTAPARNVLGLTEDQAKQVPINDIAQEVKPGDVLEFFSATGEEMGHVALVLDNEDKTWIASHWNLPVAKMVKISTSRILFSSRNSVTSAFDKKYTEYMEAINKIKSHILAQYPQQDADDEENQDLLDLVGEYSCCLPIIKAALDQHAYNDEIQAFYDKNMEIYVAVEALLRRILSLKVSDKALAALSEYVSENIGPLVSTDIVLLNDLDMLSDANARVSTKFRPYFEQLMQKHLEE